MDCNWTSFKITRQPFWKRHSWKSLGFPYSHKGHAHEIWNWNSKANLSYAAETMSPTVQKPKKSNMATRQTFRKCGNWKSIRSYSYTQVLSHWSFKFIFKAQLKLESGNQKIQYGCQAAILKLTPLKSNGLLPIYISTVPLKFGVDIRSQTKVWVRKPKNPIWPPGGHLLTRYYIYPRDIHEETRPTGSSHQQIPP